MVDSPKPMLSQSAAVALGILLTIFAVVAHRFLPERRLELDPTKAGAIYFLMKFGEEDLTKLDWVDQSRLHFRCRFANDSPGASCTYTFLLYKGDDSEHGVDLSRFRNLNLSIRYSGPAHYVRVAIRNFDPKYSKKADTNSSKFNLLNLQPKDLAMPVSIDLHQFTVPEWWVSQYNLSFEDAQPQLDNAVALSIYLQGEPANVDHDIQVDKVEFTGDWISAESWYLGILCAWMIFFASYGTTQWVRVRRRNRELKREKDKYKELSTIDGLTKVLNRHGIEQFIASLESANLPTSVIVIDLDHFKKINDHRGHYAGDRVLQNVGEILRSHTRSTDGLGRWGGEEFILVCPGATLSKAADLAEKLRQRIMKTNFIPEDPLAVTASFGVATSPAGGNFEETFQQADQALYLAKNRGRNCVVCASDDAMHTITGARKGTWALISGRFKLHK